MYEVHSAAVKAALYSDLSLLKFNLFFTANEKNVWVEEDVGYH